MDKFSMKLINFSRYYHDRFSHKRIAEKEALPRYT